MDPVELNEPVPGSYSSADARPQPPIPPVIRTLPFASKVAVWQHRVLDIDPVELNEPWGVAVSVGVAAGTSVGVAVMVAVAAGTSVGVAVDVVVAVAVGL
jgi:hypothetical protein